MMIVKSETGIGTLMLMETTMAVQWSSKIAMHESNSDCKEYVEFLLAHGAAVSAIICDRHFSS